MSKDFYYNEYHYIDILRANMLRKSLIKIAHHKFSCKCSNDYTRECASSIFLLVNTAVAYYECYKVTHGFKNCFV